MKTENSPILTKSIPKLLVQFCAPAVLAMLITGIQGMIDGMFVGRYIGSNAMASVNIAIPFVQTIIGLSMVVSIGTQSYVGLKLGMKDEKAAEDTFQTFFRIISAVAIFITIMGLLFNREIAQVLGADEVLIDDVSTYIRMFSLFALPICLMFYFGFLNRIIDKPHYYFIGSIVSVVVNISLDYFLIAVFEMGILGASLATGLAYSSSLIIVVWPMVNKKNIINVFKGKFTKRYIFPVLYNGSSEGINSISIALTAFLFNMSLMDIAGPDGVAAFTAVNYVGTLGSLVLFGISDGIGPLVSYNYGHGGLTRVKSIMKISYTLNFIFGSMIFIALFFFGETLVSFFISDNTELINMAVNGGKLYGIAFFMAGFNILTSGYFTFIGKGLQSVVVAASRGVIFVSVWIFTLPIFLDINGIWLSVAFAEACAVIVGIILLKTQKGYKKV